MTKDVLTKREKEILKLIVDGLTDEEIAVKLSVTVHTTNAYRKKLLVKLKANNTASLVREAIKQQHV